MYIVVRKTCPFYFYDNFGKCESINNNSFTVTEEEAGMRTKTCHLVNTR